MRSISRASLLTSGEGRERERDARASGDISEGQQPLDVKVPTVSNYQPRDVKATTSDHVKRVPYLQDAKPGVPVHRCGPQLRLRVDSGMRLALSIRPMLHAELTAHWKRIQQSWSATTRRVCGCPGLIREAFTDAGTVPLRKELDNAERKSRAR